MHGHIDALQHYALSSRGQRWELCVLQSRCASDRIPIGTPSLKSPFLSGSYVFLATRFLRPCAKGAARSQPKCGRAEEEACELAPKSNTNESGLGPRLIAPQSELMYRRSGVSTEPRHGAGEAHRAHRAYEAAGDGLDSPRTPRVRPLRAWRRSWPPPP